MVVYLKKMNDKYMITKKIQYKKLIFAFLLLFGIGNLIVGLGNLLTTPYNISFHIQQILLSILCLGTAYHQK